MNIDIFKDILVPVIGGLGIFMLGLEFMSNGIQALAVNRMREFLAKAAGTPIKGVLAGTLITGVIQSSTAMTVMVVGLVNAGVVALEARDQRHHGRQYRHDARQWPDRAAARAAGPDLRRRLRAGLLFRQEREGAQHRARLHGFRAHFLRPQPDDRRPSAAAQHAGGHGRDLRPARRLLLQPAQMRADRRLHHRDDPLLVGDDRHRHGPRRRRILDWTTAVAFSLGADLGTTITSWMASLNLSKNAKRAAYAHISFNIIGVCITFRCSSSRSRSCNGRCNGSAAIPAFR